MDETLNPNSESPANLRPPSGVWLTPDELDEWATALESGKYQQGQGYLVLRDERDTKRYCCLGVLGEVKGVLGSLESACLLIGGGGYVYVPIQCQGHLAALNDAAQSFGEIPGTLRKWGERLRGGETWDSVEVSVT